MIALEKLRALSVANIGATNANNANDSARNKALLAESAAKKANAAQAAAEMKKRLAEDLLIGAIQEVADAVQAEQDAFREYENQENAIDIREDLDWRRINVLPAKRRLKYAVQVVSDANKKNHEANQEVQRATDKVIQMTQYAKEATACAEVALENARNTFHEAQHMAMNAFREQKKLMR
jgi:hypothetical protein